MKPKYEVGQKVMFKKKTPWGDQFGIIIKIDAGFVKLDKNGDQTFIKLMRYDLERIIGPGTFYLKDEIEYFEYKTEVWRFDSWGYLIVMNKTETSYFSEYNIQEVMELSNKSSKTLELAQYHILVGDKTLKQVITDEGLDKEESDELKLHWKTIVERNKRGY